VGRKGGLGAAGWGGLVCAAVVGVHHISKIDDRVFTLGREGHNAFALHGRDTVGRHEATKGGSRSSGGAGIGWSQRRRGPHSFRKNGKKQPPCTRN